MAEKKKLGEILLQAGVISAEQLKEALEDQKKYGGRLGSILLDRRYIDERTYLNALSQQMKIPAVDFSKSTIPESVIHIVPREVQEKHTVFPVAIKRTPRGNILLLAMPDPTNVEVLDEIGFMSGYKVEPAIALERVLKDMIREYWYQRDGKGSYHYQPDLEIGGWIVKKAGATPEDQFVRGERVIDFDALAKSQEKPPEEDKAKPEPIIEKAKPSRELLALLRLLVKKKVITEQEYLDELKKTK